MEHLEKELELIKEYNPTLYSDKIDDINYLIENGYYDLFLKCYKTFKEKNEKTMRWEKAFELILKGFMNREYFELLNNLKDSELSKMDIVHLGILISNDHNIYNLEDQYDLKTAIQVKNSLLQSVFQELGFGKSIDEIKYNNAFVSKTVTNNLELLKDLIYQKTYNINYEQVCLLLDTYGNDISAIKGIDSSLVEMLNNIKIINSVNDMDILKKVFYNAKLSEFDFNYSTIEQSLSSSFQSIYAQTQYRPSEETFKGYLKNGIPVFEIDSEFFMNVYSLGGVFSNQTKNYLADWQQRTDLFISTSYIGNRNMNTCPIRNVCYGFASFLPKDILDAGPSNLMISGSLNFLNPGTLHKNIKLNKAKYFMPQKLLSESNKSPYTTEDGYKWNEIGYRRFDEDGNRIMPDYIVYFSDGDIDQNNTIWKNSISASEQFKIPIVIVNKQKIKEYNSQHDVVEFVPQQQIFINNAELTNANANITRLLNSYLAPHNVFHSDEWDAIKKRYNYDALDPNRRKVIGEEYIEFCEGKKDNHPITEENDKKGNVERRSR